MSKKLSDQELEEFENNRDIWQETLDGIRQIKKGQHGRKIILEMTHIDARATKESTHEQTKPS